MKAVELKDVSIFLNKFIFESLNVSFESGLITALIGKNGAGKTSLLKAIVQQLPLHTGDVFIFEEHAKHENWKDFIGVVWDDVHYPHYFTPNKLNTIQSALYPNWDAVYFKQFCEQFEIDWTQKIKQMSRGTKMKLQIGATLSHHPKLLLLDEPTGGLDPYARDEMISLLADYVEREEATAIISSHIISDIEKLADEIVVIDEGAISLQIGKDELLDTYGLWNGSTEAFEQIDQALVAASTFGSFGVRALLYKDQAQNVTFSQGMLEDYLLLFQRGSER